MLKRKEFILGAAAGLALAAGATAGGVVTWPGAHAEPVAGASGRLTASPAPAAAFAPPQGAPLSFADIFQQVSPAVVSIDVTTRVNQPRGGFITIPGLGRVPVPGSGAQDPEAEPPTAQGAGSGFFISADGYIVTNNHVVADATEIKVRLADQRELTAKVVGTDESTDLAVIKVEGADFPFVSFEDQAQPRVGDWVIAIGNPLGLGGTATAGIVSALSRQNIDPGSPGYVDFLQIDAAINRGNSGGPTFDIYGRVIGVNSAIYSQTGGSIGIGFAIPASVAKPITEQLMKGLPIARGYAGITVAPLSTETAEALSLAGTNGALVIDAPEGKPAHKSGIRMGDIITRFNNDAVRNSTELTRMIAGLAPNQQASLTILRNGRERSIVFHSDIRPEESELNSSRKNLTVDTSYIRRIAGNAITIGGAYVSNMLDNATDEIGVPNEYIGPVVVSVTPSSVSDAGIAAGMTILSVNNTRTRTSTDVVSAISEARRSGRTHMLWIVGTRSGPMPAVVKIS